MAPGGSDWDLHASWWASNFTEGADPEYEEQILPLVARAVAGRERVLDLGCGEGQVARQIARNSSVTVVGVDPSAAQLSTAVSRGSGPRYAAASGSALPFRPGGFDAVVVCLVLEHVPELGPAVDEIGRVLAPGGAFVLLVNHPLLQTPGSGWIDDRILDEQYWRVGPYLPGSTEEEEVDKGVLVTFVHRPLSAYVNAISRAGMVITGMEEPPPPPGFLARAEEYRHASTIPRLLVVRAERLTGGSAVASGSLGTRRDQAQ